MKSVKKIYSSAIFLLLCSFAAHHFVVGQSVPNSQDKKIISDFEKRAKEYSELRERIEDQLPKLPEEATSDQIESHKAAFQKAVQSARKNAKHGEIYTPEAAQLIRKIIKNEFKGKDRIELRETILEGDTKGVPVRINYPYPDSKEMLEMPPTLLLKLPQLPKQLRYRFVGQNLLLVDRENSLIVDFMTNALP